MTEETGLSPEQMEKLKQAFRDVDTNGDGKISTAELERASHALGYNPTMKELEQMMAIVDEDMNGEIDLREFAQQMLDHFGTLEEQEMAVKEAFQRLDKDGNGYIDYEELRSVLQEKGEAPLTEEEFQKLVEEIDVNQDGKIDYEELSKKMCSLEASS